MEIWRIMFQQKVGNRQMLSDHFSTLNLASTSPARLELLRRQGLCVNAYPQDCIEKTEEVLPGKVVQSLARIKLDSFLSSKDFNPDTASLASDTLLYFEGSFIGKAHSEKQAYEQISLLKGKTHRVYSGYAFYYKGKIYEGHDFAEVTFSDLSDEQVRSYIATQAWRGAAGSYHIFTDEVYFVESVHGDVSTVIGLPLLKLEMLLQSL